MTWEQILGFLIIFARPEATMTLWYRADVPFWQTFVYTTVVTSLTALLAYQAIGWLKKLVKKIFKNSRNAQEIAQKIASWYRQSVPNLDNNGYRRKFAYWLIRQKDWIVLACGFIPLPFLPTIVTVTAKLLEIKWAIPILLVGNVFRNAVTCASIYGILNALF
jgi:hypothetical protein